MLCFKNTQWLQSPARKQKTGVQFSLFTQRSEPREGNYSYCTGEYSAGKHILFFFPCWCCYTVYKILKYSFSQREQFYIMVFRLCSRKAGHHSHEYFKIVNKVEHTLSETLEKALFSLSLPHWEILNGLVITGHAWEIKVGSGLLRQMRNLKPYFLHFEWVPCQKNYWNKGDRWLLNQVIYHYVFLSFFSLSPSKVTNSSWLLEQF